MYKINLNARLAIFLIYFDLLSRTFDLFLSISYNFTNILIYLKTYYLIIKYINLY